MPWRGLATLFGPSLLLLAPFAFYQHFGGVPHFLLHTFMGWDAGLIVLLVATLFGHHQQRWEGAVPLVLAFWAMTPDFIYVFGPYHRDWMDVFLFHVSLDEVLPYAVAVEAVIWAVLATSYLLWRATAVTEQLILPRHLRARSEDQ